MKRVFLITSLIFAILFVNAQSASVSPTRLYYKNSLGETRTQKVLVLNKSDGPQSYQVSFVDFSANGKDGKVEIVPNGESKHSITPWVSASPSFFTLKSGESMDVSVTLETPNTPEAGNVKWGAMSVKLAREQDAPLDAEVNEMGMAIVNSFQFIIYLFQTPPTITVRSGEIYAFRELKLSPTPTGEILIASENTSEAILDCKTYLEYSNLGTGETTRTKLKQFTLLPGGAKENIFEIPTDLPKGKYSVMGVFDYGSPSEIKAAEIEILVE